MLSPLLILKLNAVLQSVNIVCNLHSSNRSHQAARACCYAGPRLGLWTVIPCQLIVMIGLDIVYCVTAGKAMYYVYQHTCDGYETHTCRSFGLSCWIVIFAVIQMLLSMVSLCQLNLHNALLAVQSQTAPYSRLQLWTIADYACRPY